MAVSHDGEANLQANLANVNSVTLASKTTAGSNRAAVVGFGTTTVDTSSVTHGASNYSSVVRSSHTAISCEQWVLVNPPTAATDVHIGWAASIRGGCGVSAYTGVDSTTPATNSTRNSNNGASSVGTINVPFTAGDLVLDTIVVNTGVLSTIAAGQTQVWQGVDVDGKSAQGSYKDGGSSAVVTMKWSVTSFTAWANCAFTLQATAGGGGGGATPTRPYHFPLAGVQ